MRKRFSRDRGGVYDVDLQITALADIMMVVLIFLLKSYSAGVNSIQEVETNIKIPKVVRGDFDKNGLRIEVSQRAVMVDGLHAAQLKNYRFPASDLNNDLTQNGTSIRLRHALSIFNYKDAKIYS